MFCVYHAPNFRVDGFAAILLQERYIYYPGFIILALPSNV